MVSSQNGLLKHLRFLEIFNHQPLFSAFIPVDSPPMGFMSLGIIEVPSCPVSLIRSLILIREHPLPEPLSDH